MRRPADQRAPRDHGRQQARSNGQPEACLARDRICARIRTGAGALPDQKPRELRADSWHKSIQKVTENQTKNGPGSVQVLVLKCHGNLRSAPAALKADSSDPTAAQPGATQRRPVMEITKKPTCRRRAPEPESSGQGARQEVAETAIKIWSGFTQKPSQNAAQNPVGTRLRSRAEMNQKPAQNAFKSRGKTIPEPDAF